MVRIRGSYALAMMFRDYPEEIFVARKDSPMILVQDENFAKAIMKALEKESGR